VSAHPSSLTIVLYVHMCAAPGCCDVVAQAPIASAIGLAVSSHSSSDNGDEESAVPIRCTVTRCSNKAMTKAPGILSDMHVPPEPSLLVLDCMALFRTPLNAQVASNDTE
jgi:hypothetical protein